MRREMADYLGVTKQAINNMLSRNKVPHRHWLKIEELTGGDIKVGDWR